MKLTLTDTPTTLQDLITSSWYRITQARPSNEITFQIFNNTEWSNYHISAGWVVYNDWSWEIPINLQTQTESRPYESEFEITEEKSRLEYIRLQAAPWDTVELLVTIIG